jgi:N-acetylglutamate synthase-like GNAT family acetyltransferase
VLDFISLSDTEVVGYLLEHYADIGVGKPSATLADTLNAGIAAGDLVVEKRVDAFAIVARANRKHPGRLSFIEIAPQADLMFVMVANDARGKRSGSRLISEVKRTYMEGQAMALVCAGEGRKQFFESAGFREVGTNVNGHFLMFCKAE